MGLIAVNPKEEASIAKIRYVRTDLYVDRMLTILTRMEFSRAEDLARDKVALSERGVALVCLFTFP